MLNLTQTPLPEQQVLCTVFDMLAGAQRFANYSATPTPPPAGMQRRDLAARSTLASPVIYDFLADRYEPPKVPQTRVTSPNPGYGHRARHWFSSMWQRNVQGFERLAQRPQAFMTQRKYNKLFRLILSNDETRRERAFADMLEFCTANNGYFTKLVSDLIAAHAWDEPGKEGKRVSQAAREYYDRLTIMYPAKGSRHYKSQAA